MNSNETIIKKCKEVYGDRYVYSLVEYKKFDKKIKIICPTHGIFEQLYHAHIGGQNCPKCSIEKRFKFDTKSFINECKIIHKNKYDYSLVEYKNSKTKIKIICPIHGVFEQLHSNHIGGQNCPKCENKKLNNNKFIERSLIIHNNKYDYSLVDYKNNRTKVEIICPTHGIFYQLPSNHLVGSGCKQCDSNNRRINIYEFMNYHYTKRCSGFWIKLIRLFKRFIAYA